MKTLSFKGPLCESDAFERLQIAPGPGADLLILPDVPAVSQARAFFADRDSAPFITTFGQMARKTNAAGARRGVLSRTGSMILMRHAAAKAGMFPRSKPAAALVYELLSLGAELKHGGITPEEFAEKTEGTSPSTARKARRLADALAAFEKEMENTEMIDNAGLMDELPRSFERMFIQEGGAGRVVAAGFDRLTPPQERVLLAAEKAGIAAALIRPAEPDAADIAVSAASFPSFADEAEFAAAEIRKLAERGVDPSGCAVIMREMSRGGEVASALERCGLAVDLRRGANAGGAGAMPILLQQFLIAAGAGFASAEFAALIRNPLLQDFFGEQCRFETARVMEAQIAKTGGLCSLDEAVAPLPRPAANRARELAAMISEELADGGEPPGGAPPKGAPPGEAAALAALRRLVDATGAAHCGADGGEREAVRDALREAEFFCGLWGGEGGSWEDLRVFVADILAGRGFSRKIPAGAAGRRVTVTDALEARGACYSAVFVLDCADGSFPRARADGAMFGDDEKRLMNDRLGVSAFATAADYRDRERLIWNSVAACAGGRLYISFAREGGRQVSPFAAETAEFRAEGGGVFPASPYCADSAMAAEVARSGTVGEKTAGLLAAADPFFELASRAVRGAEAEKQRLRPHGEISEFEGAAGSAAAEGVKPVSVGGVESIGRCPFVFFCSNILGIKEGVPAAAVPPPADTGALYHAALRFVFGNGGEEALEDFLSKEETKRAHCRVPDAVWELQKRRAAAVLKRFLSFENRRISGENLKPALFEHEIETEIAGVKVRGKLDRMDYDETGGVRVVDYKKGGVEGTFCDRGRLQIPLYLRAVSEELGAEARGGDYVSVERAPDKKSVSPERSDDAVRDAVRFAESNLGLVKKGLFPPFPLSKTEDFPFGEFFPAKNNMCVSCAFADVCRIKSGVSRTAGGRRG